VAIPFWVPLLAALVCGIYEILSVRTVPPLKTLQLPRMGACSVLWGNPELS